MTFRIGTLLLEKLVPPLHEPEKVELATVEVDMRDWIIKPEGSSGLLTGFHTISHEESEERAEDIQKLAEGMARVDQSELWDLIKEEIKGPIRFGMLSQLRKVFPEDEETIFLLTYRWALEGIVFQTPQQSWRMRPLRTHTFEDVW